MAGFSQSGGEICNLVEAGHRPDMIFTNNFTSATWDPRLAKLKIPVFLCKDLVGTWDTILRNKPKLVTLHGYLKIVPAKYCSQLTIINGHPGDIVMYPELAGKDPQKKAIELGVPASGVVLHQVTEVLDGGPIIAYETLPIPKGTTTEQLILSLKELQLRLWIEALEVML